MLEAGRRETWKKMKGVSLLPPLNFSRQLSIMAGKHAVKDAGEPAFDSPWYLKKY
jgi:hypothetical protein